MAGARKTSRPRTQTGPSADEDALAAAYARSGHNVVFWLNGARVELVNPDPRMPLVNYLRASEVGLTGTKVGCREGGCGACTVMLSHYDVQQKKVLHKAINSCLRPVPMLDGACITTVEGLGSVKTTLNEWQEKIAAGNGSQCGFCTPGFVMSMCTAALANPSGGPEDIEIALDGNLCRCTGYRPILQAFGATGKADPCPVVRNGDTVSSAPLDSKSAAASLAPFRTPAGSAAPKFSPRVPKEATERALHPRPLAFRGQFGRWFRPVTVADACALKVAAGEHGIYVQGNTSTGIFERPFDPCIVLIDTSRIEQLRDCEFNEEKGGISIGGAVTLARLLEIVQEIAASWKDRPTESLMALRDCLRLVGNTHIRNLGTVSGNLMLTRRQAWTDDPFPSDMYTALATLGATIHVTSLEWPQPQCFGMMEFLKAVLPMDAVLTGIFIPAGDANEKCRMYKVARRLQNAHSIVNGGFRVTLNGQKVADDGIAIVFGGIAKAPWRATKTETWLKGRSWNQATLAGALRTLKAELRQNTAKLQPGCEPVDCRASLAEAIFYKFFVNVALQVAPDEVSAGMRSAGEDLPLPVSQGTEEFEVFPSEFPTSASVVKLTAFSQASGEARYTHDLPLPPRTLQGVLLLSTEANASFEWKPDLDKLIRMIRREYPGVHDVVTVRDIPNLRNNMSGIGNDDPIFADGSVTCAGQPLALVLAEHEQQALAAVARLEKFVHYRKKKTVLTMTAALALPRKQGIFELNPRSAPFLTYFDRLQRPGSNQKWLRSPEKPLPGTMVVQGRQRSGEQIHFYMETQAVLAVPGDGGAITVHAGTQDLDTLQNTVAQVLGIPVNAVTVGVGLIGGGFGGKTTRVPFFATQAALAAQKHRRPVRLVLSRQTDSRVMGKRHPVDGHYHAMFSSDGRIHGYKSLGYWDGGNTYDCTFFILDEAQMNGDSAYMIPTYHTEAYAYRTNKPSNTAMRSFGVTQAAMVRESAMERVAHELGVLPETIREKNLYRTGSAKKFDLTPYGEPLKDCDIRGLWRLMKKKADFVARERGVRKFNSDHRWRKRGISMIPLKYGIAYTRRMLNQGRSIINVYHADGSLILMHGGVEVGQGIHTKMAQIAASELNVPMDLIRVPETNTRAIGNATSTGASTGADLNGVAVQKAAVQLRKRLEQFCLHLKKMKGEKHCIEQGVAFWKYKEGWRAMVKAKGSTSPAMMWTNVVNQAWLHRIDLTSEAFYKTPHVSQLSDKHPYGRPYFYYTYGVACSEVEIDVLTGESMVVRADIVYENAKSLNPALDIGQIQGAFVQCIGNMTTEEVLLDEGGRLISYGTWDYKPPTSASIPRDFRVTLLEHAPITQQAEHVLDADALAGKTSRGAVVGHTAAQSSRTVGEPPFVLGTSVFFAIRRAVAAARKDRGDNDWVDLDAPATVQRIHQACKVSGADMKLSG